MNRVALFMLAPVPASILGGLVSYGTGGHPRPISVAVFYLLQLYALQLVFGLAILAWLVRSGRQSIISFALGGVMMVAVVAVPYLFWASVGAENTAPRLVTVLLLWLAYGAITGATAWIGVRGQSASAERH